ncbi:TIGR02611 family protein [Micromonospora pallida]|uniref:TIGR02611 family protein n=2 Tax=Micromonospora pallida TaxID=145854 RepID=A0A1C6STX5_9ACTN|nr:TIGR02611 family protein [Micromonospora pallida]
MVAEQSSMEAAVGRRSPGPVTGKTGKRGYGVPEKGRGHDRLRGHGANGTTGVQVAERRVRWRRLRTTLELVRANPTGRIALKVFVAVAGALVVAIGAVLIPLPGPGWLLVIAGLGIWAVEFHWARRLLNFTRRHVQGWTRWVTSRSWPVRLVLGSVGLLFVCSIVWLSLKVGLGIDVVARLLHYLATN